VCLAALVVAAASGAACREAVLALAPAPETAAIRADELLGTLQARFGPRVADPRFDALRERLARAVLVPSRVYDKPAEGMRVDGESRTAAFLGRRTAAGYLLIPSPDAPRPRRPPQYAGEVRLRRVSGSEYEWSVRDELSVGGPYVSDLAAGFGAILGAARAAARDGMATVTPAFPRTARSLRGLLAVESLRAEPAPGGATAVDLAVRIRPEAIQAEYPAYARYLRQHVAPVRAHLGAVDEAGLRWCEVGLDQLRFSLRFAAADRSLVPLAGAPRACPAALRLQGEVLTRPGLFTIGLKGLDGDVRWTRAEGRFSIELRFARQPDWQLPFLVEPLIASSLRRPFEGEGISMRLAAEDDPIGGTLWTRALGLAVRESWIIRWLGGIVGGAAGDFVGAPERESERLNGDVLEALRADIRSELAGQTE
jgi:hypothetical protein